MIQPRICQNLFIHTTKFLAKIGLLYEHKGSRLPVSRGSRHAYEYIIIHKKMINI